MVYVASPSSASSLWAGDPAVALPGSGTSLNAGLESTFTYGGMVINDLTVVDDYVLTKIDGLDDGDVRFAEDDAPSDDGTIPRLSFYGGRTIVLTGYINAHNLNKLRDMQTALQLAFSRLTEDALYVTTLSNPSTAFYVNCRKSQKIVMGEVQGGETFRRDFMVTLRASNPRKFLVDGDFDTLTHGFGAGGSLTTSFFTNNVGTFTAQPKIRVYSEGGASDVSLTNNVNGDAFTIDTIAAGRWYEMNVEERRIYDDTGANARAHFSGSAKYVKYDPGINTMTVAVSSGVGFFYLTSTFNPAYI